MREASQTTAGEHKDLVVRAGAHRRQFCPLQIAAPGVMAGAWALEDVQSGRQLPAQVVEGPNGEPELHFVLDFLAAWSERRFRLTTPSADPAAVAAATGVTLAEEPGAIAVNINGELFTRYHYGADVVRPFLYPVIGPYGATVTRHYPMADVPGEKRDHPHHRSVWFTHGDVNGVDNWSELKDHGYTRHQQFTRPPVGGAVFGEFEAANQWTDAQDKPVVANNLSLRFYIVPMPYRLVDVTVSFHAEHGPVMFGDTKEGGLLSVRVATSMDAAREGRIENGVGGVGEAETWGKRAPWCDYSGPVATPHGGPWVGISLFDHPTNPRYPTHWHVRAYGLMTANCFGLSHFTNDKRQDGSLRLEAGERLTFRYRMYMHPGRADDGQVQDRWLDFAYPPSVAWA